MTRLSKVCDFNERQKTSVKHVRTWENKFNLVLEGFFL